MLRPTPSWPKTPARTIKAHALVVVALFLRGAHVQSVLLAAHPRVRRFDLLLFNTLPRLIAPPNPRGCPAPFCSPSLLSLSPSLVGVNFSPPSQLTILLGPSITSPSRVLIHRPHSPEWSTTSRSGPIFAHSHAYRAAHRAPTAACWPSFGLLVR